jgi:hypothetical protein
MGLEGIVSKRLSKPYQSGRSRHWLKIKNPDSDAASAGPAVSAALASRQEAGRLCRPRRQRDNEAEARQARANHHFLRFFTVD